MADKAKCVILGGGGHARVVLDCLRLSDAAAEAICILDANQQVWGRMVDGVPVRGGDDQLAGLLDEGVGHFLVGLGMGPRERIYSSALAAGFQPWTIIHPRATVSSVARIGAGNQIFAAAVVNPGAELGVNVLINTGAIVEHDCVLDDHASVASGACLAGGVTVEKGAFIGAGSIIRQGLRIGAGAKVGAGAVVTKDVAAGTTVAGVPAREMT